MADSAPHVLLCRNIPTDLLEVAEKRGMVKLIRRPESEQEAPAPRAWILDNIGKADAAVITLTERIDGEIVKAGKKLQVLSTMSVGTDHIDVHSVNARKIKLGTTPDVLDEAVAELTLLLMLSVMRNIPRASRVVQEGKWSENPWAPTAFCGPALRGKTVGFVGFGNIAQSVAALLPVFGPSRILYTTSTPKPFNIQADAFARLRERGFPHHGPIKVENKTDLLQLATESDVVVVLTSLNASTEHLIGQQFLSQMKNTAVLVNTSRGPVVDTTALARTLEHGRIWAAGLDVLEGEPNVGMDHVLLQPGCRDRVLLLPHIGSATLEARQAMADLTARHVLEHFNAI